MYASSSDFLYENHFIYKNRPKMSSCVVKTPILNYKLMLERFS